jgi:hypothetical protein
MAVAIAFAVVNSLLLLWVLALTWRARRTLPPGAQFPVHAGLGGWDKWWPVERALFVWPVIGAVIWLADIVTMVIAVVGAASSKDGIAAVTAILTIPMIMLPVTEHFALRAARTLSHPTRPDDRAARRR